MSVEEGEELGVGDGCGGSMVDFWRGHGLFEVALRCSRFLGKFSVEETVELHFVRVVYRFMALFNQPA